jgi:hypothetical protein
MTVVDVIVIVVTRHPPPPLPVQIRMRFVSARDDRAHVVSITGRNFVVVSNVMNVGYLRLYKFNCCCPSGHRLAAVDNRDVIGRDVIGDNDDGDAAGGN